MTPRIFISGVTGFTGQLIANELIRHSIQFGIIGRDKTKLNHWQKQYGHSGDCLTTDFSSGKDLRKVLEKTDLIINCVGPFNLFSKKICSTAIEMGKTYFDITGEQSFVKSFHEQKSVEAEKNGSVVVQSLAYESCLADVLSNNMIQQGEAVEDISSYYYSFASRSSPGSRLTMEIIDFFPGYGIQDHKYLELRPLSWFREVNCPGLPGIQSAFFAPYPEVVFFEKKYHPKISGSFILSPEIASVISKIKPGLVKKDLNQILERHNKKKPRPISLSERKNQPFILFVQAKFKDGRQITRALEGIDGYGITATIIIESLLYFLNHGRPSPGIKTPSEFFGDYPLFKSIKTRHRIKIKSGTELLEVCNSILETENES